MLHVRRESIALALAVAVFIFAPAISVCAQDTPYREESWGKLPDGRKWGSTSAINIDRAGNIWVFERCGAVTCAGSSVAPLVKLDSSGNYITSFGAGMFVAPHGIHIDRDGNIWVTDFQAKDGKGNVVV